NGPVTGPIPLWYLISNDDGDIFTETGVLIGSYSFRTTDNAITWDQIGITGAFLQSISFNTSGFTYAVYQGNLPPGNTNLYKSSDKGDNWQNISGVPSLLHIVYVAKNGHIYVGSNTALYKSIDDGVSWSQILNQVITDIAENQLGHLFVTTSAGVFRSIDAGLNWMQINSGLDLLYTSKATIDSLGYIYVLSGIDQNSQTKLYRSVESTIPVELVSFSADVINDEVHLNWVTASETNNYGFEVERFSKSVWFNVAFIEGDGTTTETNHYKFIDKDLCAGKYLYRLKQIDYDGSFEYSNVVEVEIKSPQEFSLFQNFPNPFNPATIIEFQIANSGFVSLKVYDVLGNEIATLVNEEKPAGSYQVNFDATGIPSGVYFYKLNAGEFSQTKKMILMK
ncbi:MAG TPA: T9SS type A sorting domain-containing protein, partial [Ignavibacteriaceae bacterium]